MKFNLPPYSRTNTFANQPLSHPLSIGNEFMPHPINQLSEEAENDFEIISQFAQSQGWVAWIDFKKHLIHGTNSVVISDKNQIILYVSKGFEKMTGYPDEFTKGKKAKFLQGTETEMDVINTIKKAIEQREFVDCVITNYRKNGESYLCRVTIFPMFNSNNELVNFVALEGEVYA